MNYQHLFAFFLAGFTLLLYLYNRKSNILRDLILATNRDESKEDPRPFSFARVQLAWWSIIILSAYASAAIATRDLPLLDSSALILLGIGVATKGFAGAIDVSDKMLNRLSKKHVQKKEHRTFLLDLMSDKNGASISRFQAIAFNLIIGVWFIIKVWNGLGDYPVVGQVIPTIDANNLALMGISSGGYLGVKTQENKP